MQSAQEIPFQSLAKSVLSFLRYNSNDFTFLVDVSPFSNINGPRSSAIATGYAINELGILFPSGQKLANDISVIMFSNYTNDKLPWALPDGGCQILVKYNDKGQFDSIDSLDIWAQHQDLYSFTTIAKQITTLCSLAFQNYKVNPDIKFFINAPNNKFVVGGPQINPGISGCKTASDMYGCYAPCGSSPIGKDPMYVERFGNYYARYVAKNLVASEACDRITIQIAYAQGVPFPTGVSFDCAGTEKVPLAKIEEAIHKFFNYSPASIISQFNLKHIKYLPYACFGFFGRVECESPWEKLDKVEELKEFFDKEN